MTSSTGNELWKQERQELYGIKELVSSNAGYGGKRVTLPHTIENVSKIMNMGLSHGVGNGMASLMRPMKTTIEISKEQDRLVSSHEELNIFDQYWEDVYSRTPYLTDESGLHMANILGQKEYYRMMTQPNPIDYLKSKHGIELEEHKAKLFQHHIDAIRNERPAIYFETKFERPVRFGEFAAAVVPENTPADVVDFLRSQGLQIETYDTNDKASRRAAMQRATQGEGVRFRVGNKKARTRKTHSGKKSRLDQAGLNHLRPGGTREYANVQINNNAAKNTLLSFANECTDSNDPKGYLTELSHRLQLTKYPTGSSYGDFMLPNGNMATIRISNHNMTCSRVKDLPVISIVIKSKKKKKKFVAAGGKMADEFVFLKEDLLKASPGTLKQILKNLAELFTTGVFANSTGLAKLNISPTGRTSALFTHNSINDDSNLRYRDVSPQMQEELNSIPPEELNQTKSAVTTLMRSTAEAMAGRLNLTNMDIVEDGSGLQGKQRSAKGFYDTRTGRITIVLGNHMSERDVERTILHEAVAHLGLRKLLGERFNEFLDGVYANASEEIRREIAAMAARNGWDFRTATEEYLAGLAENMNFRNAWWEHIKQMFFAAMRKVGLLKNGAEEGVITDSELRYMLWQSYYNLKNGGGGRGYMAMVDRIGMEQRLGVGNFSPTARDVERSLDDFRSSLGQQRADEGVLFRMPEGTARASYDQSVATRRKAGPNDKCADKGTNYERRLREAYLDSMQSLNDLQKAVAEESGLEIEDHDNA